MSTETTELAETQTPTTLGEMPLDSEPLVVQEPSNELPSSPEWLRDKERIDAFFNDPISYTSEFIQPYKPILFTIGFVLLAIIGTKLILSLLGAIFSVVTGIPIFSQLLEIVGLGYTGWFVYRYLLKAETRQELSQKIDQLKQEFVGGAGE